MLEIKHLTKIYKVKGGAETRALDDVSVNFPETGMVFLLGKSGSGKSTLLNLCGGLDTPTSGEIIVKGRSSKSFSGSDFDSYRNTFIGFIFQEYNILNEFSVEDNLSIALELQGKPRDKALVAQLLKQVDLDGYAKRKPNTLSGGQKQRIAIARALIKDPKIIMADEPTGALDSATGKQVFDTLKKLSADRLVIVVSHDREFAEYYADRIIELKDGKIISDVTKRYIPPKRLSENVAVIGGDTISVKEGSRLTEDDFESIKRFLLDNRDGLIISKGEKNVRAYKMSNGISDDGSSECFSDTTDGDVQVKTYAKAESRFVRSHLPLSKAFKMGSSSLKVKPVRLVFTVLLSVVAFIMFGLFSTLMVYNENNVVRESFASSTYDSIALSKNYRYVTENYHNGEFQNSYENSDKTVMTDADVQALKNAVGNVIPYYSFSGRYSSSISVSNLSTLPSTPQTMSNTSATGFATLDSETGSGKMLFGSYPDALDEIAISKYYATCLLNGELREIDEYGQISQTAVTLNGIGDAVGKKLSLRINNHDVVLTISGVFDGGEVPEKYSGYDVFEQAATWDLMLLLDYSMYIGETLQKIFLVKDGFYEYTADLVDFRQSEDTVDDYNKYFGNGYYVHCYTDWFSYSVSGFKAYDATDPNALTAYFFESGKTTLSGNQVLIPANYLPISDTWTDESGFEAFVGARMEKYDNLSQKYQLLRDKYYDENADNQVNVYYFADRLYQAFKNAKQKDQLYGALWSLRDGLQSIEWDGKGLTDEERAEVFTDVIDVLFDYIRQFGMDKMTFTLSGDNGSSHFIDVVGVYIYPIVPEGKNYRMGMYVSAEALPSYSYENEWYSKTVTKYVFPKADVYYNGVFVPYDNAHKQNIEKVLELNNVMGEDDSYFAIDNTLYRSVKSISDMVKNMGQVFFYVGLAMALFASLLLFNFISVSINGKMHEIGVLRAVGARGADVFKIFFSESFIISLICIAISLVGTYFLLIVLNNSITEVLTFSMRLLVFGPVTVAMIAGVALVVAVLGTFLAVAKISSKKPVESMKGL